MRELQALDEAEQRLARRNVKKRFRSTLMNLFLVEIYWSPSRRWFIARATSRTRKVSRLPADALLVGTYSHPFDANDFLDDLDDVVVKATARRHDAPAAAPALAFAG